MLGLLSLTLIAQPYTVRVDASSTNIPTTFSTASTSRILQNIPFANSAFIDNTQIAGELVVNCQASNTVAPSNSSQQNLFIQANQAWVVDHPYFNGNGPASCFIRSNTGSAITTGIFVLTLTGG